MPATFLGNTAILPEKNVRGPQDSTKMAGIAPGEMHSVLAQLQHADTQPRSQLQEWKCSCEFWGQWILTAQQPQVNCSSRFYCLEKSVPSWWSGHGSKAPKQKMEISPSLGCPLHRCSLEKRQAVLKCSSRLWLKCNTDILSEAKCLNFPTFLACVTMSALTNKVFILQLFHFDK